jgi:hypothetical protein
MSEQMRFEFGDYDPFTLSERIQTVSTSLAELKAKYEPVAVTDDAIILAQPPFDAKAPNRPGFNEIGTTGNSQFTGMVREDYNPDLVGWQGIQTYDKMRRSDGQVRATLRLVKTPVLAARWYVEPADDTPEQEEIAKLVERNLFYLMSTSWPQLLSELLLMLDFGYYIFEKVFSIYEGKIIWRKFAPRHPSDVDRWEFDANGGPRGVWLTSLDNGVPIFLPIWKLALFTFDKEGGNLEGISVLRSAYKHWFYKENLYKIDAIQKERHGIGVPIIVLPPNFTEQDRRLADELGQNLRTNEKAHITVPPLWEIKFAKLEGNLVNALDSAEHHDLLIARNILGQFLNAQAGTSQEEQQQLFLKATRYIADTVRDVFNKHCIPQVVRWNFGEQEYYPELRVRRIGDTVDWRTLSFAIRNFVGAGLVNPDERLEAWIRDEMDLPKADPDSRREVAQPQAPPQAPQPGPPRQSQAPNQRVEPQRGAAGRDVSGEGK